MRVENLIPIVLIGMLVSATGFTMLESVNRQLHMHIELHHYLHDELFHYFALHQVMWVFFCYLGLEIRIKTLISAARISLPTVLGGMVVPVGLTYLLTQNVYIALGAAATDVAFSIGALNMARGTSETILRIVYAVLLLVGVGDDMAGVALAVAVYTNVIVWEWAYGAGFTIYGAFHIGERGYEDDISERLDEYRNPIPGTLEMRRKHIENLSVPVWVGLSVLNSLTLWLAGVEWLLGGCLVLIFAPEKIKHQVGEWLKPWVAVLLFFFGLAAGAIDLLDPTNWGWMTFATFVGGMFGKQIGIGGGALIGRYWTKLRDPDSEFASMTLQEIYALAVFASVNGTVAIFFVTLGAQKGLIPPDHAAQGTLGYFLTVPAVYIQAFVGSKIGYLRIDNGPCVKIVESVTSSYDQLIELLRGGRTRVNDM